MLTPDWIQNIIDANDGGWAIPFRLWSLDHPLLKDRCGCEYCEETFVVDSVVVVMPYMGPTEEESRWIWVHRTCLLRTAP